MLLKQHIIEDIETLSPRDLLLVQSVINILKNTKQPAELPNDNDHAYLKIREILAHCEGSLTEDILCHREERV